MSEPALNRLSSIIEELGPLAVAVSGGVDSMTLATVADAALGADAHMLHAVSPAVPADATARVRKYAEARDWNLSIIDALEFQDENYVANPVNRCFYCKSNLYDTMASRIDCVLVSGTNVDDLGDYRPGLSAAKARGVRHPFVEAGIDKRMVRSIARSLGLEDLAELAASPCLSSRVETGIAIEPLALGAIYHVEKYVRHAIRPEVVRCRIRHGAVVVELDDAAFFELSECQRDNIVEYAQRQLAAAGVERQVEFAVYKMGSAFLRSPDEG